MAHLKKILFVNLAGIAFSISAISGETTKLPKNVDLQTINEVVKVEKQKLPIDVISADFNSLVEEKKVNLDRDAIQFDDTLEELEAKTLEGGEDSNILDDIQL
ncbi:MAG: hypothetical protein VX642_03530 [Bdellovibrionota bacterium]|nr:hypothetical protein [Bdellovibrionota bacterium]